MIFVPCNAVRRLLLALFFVPVGSPAGASEWPPSTADINALKINAVLDTIAATPACRRIGDFYWEIGDRNARLASGQVGKAYTENTIVLLASASKLPFSAYFVQRFGNPDATQKQQMTMQAGYMYFVDALCFVQPTIDGCFKAPSPLFPSNSWQNPQEVGQFLYSGGNFQKVAVDAGLGRMTPAALEADMRKWLGSDIGVKVLYPGVASGLAMNAKGYATLLRKIMADELAISGLMGSNSTCTLPQTCPTASFTPMDWYDWDYSIGHWIEREPNGPAEAYNSIGLLGFYPWITPDRQLYGVISTANLDVANAGPNSLVCGKNMREAWLSGVMHN